MTTFERTDAPFTASAPAERRTGGERAPDAAHPRPTGVRCASPSRAYSTGWRPAAYVPGSIDILSVSPRPFESCRCCSRVRLRRVERCIRQAVPGRDPRTRASVVAWAFRGGSQLARAALPQPVPGVHGVLEKCRPSPGPWPLPVDHQHRHLAFARRATDLARVVPKILSRAVRVDLRREIAILRECPVGGPAHTRPRWWSPGCREADRPGRNSCSCGRSPLCRPGSPFGSTGACPKRPPRLGLVASEGCSSIGYTRLTAHSGQPSRSQLE
jgi:hypothetical protein